MAGRTYLVGTHSFLLSLHVDETWSVQNHRVLNEGHHYGIAFSEQEERTVMVKRPNSGGREFIIFGAEVLFEKSPQVRDTAYFRWTRGMPLSVLRAINMALSPPRYWEVGIWAKSALRS